MSSKEIPKNFLKNINLYNTNKLRRGLLSAKYLSQLYTCFWNWYKIIMLGHYSCYVNKKTSEFLFLKSTIAFKKTYA